MKHPFIKGMGFGFLILLASAGEDYSHWKVQPKMIQEPEHVDYRECYVGTDGLLHEAPKARVIW